jgi:hypothetical protein
MNTAIELILVTLLASLVNQPARARRPSAPNASDAIADSEIDDPSVWSQRPPPP